MTVISCSHKPKAILTHFDNFIKKKKNQFHGVAFSTCGALSSKFWFEVSGVRDVN